MSAPFYLKNLDTQSIFQATLRKPDGTIYNPTGATALKLHVQLLAGTFTRDLGIVGAGDASPNVQYAWLATDWTAAPPTVNLAIGCWRLECEVLPTAGQRITFINSGFDWLLVTPDLGQG